MCGHLYFEVTTQIPCIVFVQSKFIFLFQQAPMQELEIVKDTLPRKSMIKRPSQNRPDGLRKYVCPLGCPIGKAIPAAKPPVSEFESPKLKIAGILKSAELTIGKTKKVKASM